MTRKRATQILIHYAAGFCEGSGVGLRQVPSDQVRGAIREACQKLWPDAFDYPFSETQLEGMGWRPHR